MDYKELRNPSQPADTPDGFVSEIRSIIDQARSNAVRSVDFCRVRMLSLIHISEPTRP